MGKDTKLVSLCRTYDNTEAELIRSFLESENIPCYINTNDASGVLPYLALTQGGSEVYVREEDLKAARALLEEMDNAED